MGPGVARGTLAATAAAFARNLGVSYLFSQFHLVLCLIVYQAAARAPAHVAASAKDKVCILDLQYWSLCSN